MGYTRHKIRTINLSFFLAALAFSGWAFYAALTGQPRSFPGAGTVGFILFGLAAIFFAAFPLIWTRYPSRHPVLHALARFGNPSDISRLLDREMSAPVAVLGPFRFTASFLVYDSGLEFQLIPYDQIARAELASDEGVAAVVVHTRGGRTYQWFRSWMQGRFGPAEVLEKIRSAARLDASPSTANPSP
jgi:hypothetical protein